MSGTACEKVQKKSVSINHQFKEHINRLDGFVCRLEKARQNIYSIPLTIDKAPVLGDGKKEILELSFLEIWMDHIQYFINLLARLEKVTEEFEEF